MTLPVPNDANLPAQIASIDRFGSREYFQSWLRGLGYVRGFSEKQRRLSQSKALLAQKAR